MPFSQAAHLQLRITNRSYIPGIEKYASNSNKVIQQFSD